MLAYVFVDLKDFIGDAVHLSPDALHVHAGLVLFLGALLMRSERRYLYSLGWLIGLCLIGELFDLSYDYSQGYRLCWLNGLKDIVNTVLWPAIWVAAGPAVMRTLRRE